MATLQTRLTELAQAAGTSDKAIKTLVNGNAADLSALQTTAKGNLVAAINEVRGTAAAAQTAAASAAAINDAATATTSVWSSSKTNTAISTAVAAVVNSAPATLDTLAEISAALGADANFATTMTTALGLRVRVDAAQTFTAGQQLQGRANIGAQAASEIGTADTDFAAIFTAALA